MSRILLRFNTKFQEDPQKRTWRVLVDGKEKLADKVFIRVAGETVQEYVDGILKYHILCDGHVIWNNDTATIAHCKDLEFELTQNLLDEINNEWSAAGY